MEGEDSPAQFLLKNCNFTLNCPVIFLIILANIYYPLAKLRVIIYIIYIRKRENGILDKNSIKVNIHTLVLELLMMTTCKFLVPLMS